MQEFNFIEILIAKIHCLIESISMRTFVGRKENNVQRLEKGGRQKGMIS
jgi:hypothetical protein